MTSMTPKRAAALVKKHGSIFAAARAEKIPRGTFQRYYHLAVAEGLAESRSGYRGSSNRALALARDIEKKPYVGGKLKPAAREVFPVPAKGKVARYILTSAQNNTELHEGLWVNLNALAKHYDARIMVATFTYDAHAFGEGSVKRGTEEHSTDIWYTPEIEPHTYDKSAQLAPGLVWCGNINILPTAVRPLSGLENYTGRQSGIFPHPKLAMDSIPSGKFEPTKFNYTTGAVTKRHYIQKKAGQKAEFHHCYGALLVEVDSDGDWFVRQLNGDSEGVVYDLTVCAKDGKVSDGWRVEAITWGDIHVGQTDDMVKRLAWGAAPEGGFTTDDCMLAVLQPRQQFLHDLLDFHSRNHHESKNPHKRFERFQKGQEVVEREVDAAARFASRVTTLDCKTVIVDSNHDNALERWLREGDYRFDPVNAVYFLKLQLRKYEAMEKNEHSFHLVEYAMRRVGIQDKIKFLREDESYIICKDANGGIECGMHGHLGPNGARGSANAFARMGRKANVGHTHSAGIHDGIYTAGTSSVLDLGYNRGPGSWSHSHVVTYKNGKRAIITMWNNKWRAT